MRGKGHGGIDAVLRTTDGDHASDRILRAQFWLPQVSPPSSTREVVALDSRRPLAR